jgi:hypothetical protein
MEECNDQLITGHVLVAEMPRDIFEPMHGWRKESLTGFAKDAIVFGTENA